MHDARRTEPSARGGGIPDGLLVALLAFLLGLAVLVWTATGLAALFTKGSWPDTVTFTRTPTAVRALIAQPHDIPAAWPDTDPAALSGWGLFWGLFVSQLLILFVLTVFVIGVVARTKARRALAKQTPPTTPPQTTAATPTPAPTTPAPTEPVLAPAIPAPTEPVLAATPAIPAPPAFEARGSGGRAPRPPPRPHPHPHPQRVGDPPRAPPPPPTPPPP
ncbi:type VI secretion protein, partial [Streptomyces erythrochromogenes]